MSIRTPCFNPASAVKLPLAMLSLEKLHELKQYGVDMETPMAFDSSQAWQRPLLYGSTSAHGLPSIVISFARHYW